MRKFKCFVASLAVLFCLSSCVDHARIRETLSRADSLIEKSSDSALALLRRDSLLFMRAGKDEKMAYELLRHEAEDKCYIPHLSDSVMLLVVKYYETEGTPLQQVRSNYMLGRVYCDMQHYGSAFTTFEKALKIEGNADPAVCRYKARACSWIASVYEDKQLYEKVLLYSKRFYGYAIKADKPSLIVYSLRDIGRGYSWLKQNNIAIKYYQRAANKARELKDYSLYSIVNEELAVIFIEEQMYDKAREALSTPYQGSLNTDIASHYFTWAVLYDSIGKVDSAIIFNKKGMEYATTPVKKEISFSLASIYEKVGDNVEARKYHKLYSLYDDTLNIERTIESEDFINHIEKNIEKEQENISLVKSRKRLIVFIILFCVISFVIVAFLIKLNRRQEKQFEEQQKDTETYWMKWKRIALSSIREKTEHIKSLEAELSSSAERSIHLEQKLKMAETEKQDIQKKQMLYEKKYSEFLAADFADTDIYKLFHNPIAKPTNADYHKLAAVINEYYEGFTMRLKEFYPDMDNNELWLCCMVKIGLTPKEICNITKYKYNTLSMMKVRLYGKMFENKGKTKDFDDFIRDF